MQTIAFQFYVFYFRNFSYPPYFFTCYLFLVLLSFPTAKSFFPLLFFSCLPLSCSPLYSLMSLPRLKSRHSNYIFYLFLDLDRGCRAKVWRWTRNALARLYFAPDDSQLFWSLSVVVSSYFTQVKSNFLSTSFQFPSFFSNL